MTIYRSKIIWHRLISNFEEPHYSLRRIRKQGSEIINNLLNKQVRVNLLVRSDEITQNMEH